ncbi:hypothetical protein LLEC1_05822, partial [Akanthomyces lecanii]
MAAAAVQSAPIFDGQPRVQLEQHEEHRVPKHDVTACLNFYQPNADGSPPPPTYVDRPETYQQQRDTHQIIVKDIAGDEDQYSLDRNGFQVYQRAAAERDFTDEEQIKSGYYAETEQLLKDVTGADRIFIFDHTIRRAPAGSTGDRLNRAPV